MKKIFVAVLAVAAMVACSTEQTIVAPQGEAIGFDTFVENSTRANDLVAGNFDFGVYGLVAKGGESALIFNDKQIAKDGTYSPAQYWIASAQYYFSAFAPYTGRAWSYDTTTAHTGTVTFNNNTAQANQDFLFAYVQPDVTPDKITGQPEAVKFTFKHMLSRVMFTFSNDFANNSNIALEVYDVTITDAIDSAKLAINEGTAAAAWKDFSTTTFSRNFGQVVSNETRAHLVDAGVTGGTVSASTEHFYLIPANKAYNVTFKVDLYQAGVKLDTYTRSATIPATEMKSGMSYNIKTSLTPQNTSDDGQLYPIVFNVDGVDGWDSADDVDATVNAPVNTPATGNN
jgi:hypothetical protein